MEYDILDFHLLFNIDDNGQSEKEWRGLYQVKDEGVYVLPPSALKKKFHQKS